MNDEILKLAFDCGFRPYSEPKGTTEMYCWRNHVEAFYKAAFNAGITAAATTVCECAVTQMTGGLRKEFFDAIQKLEKAK